LIWKDKIIFAGKILEVVYTERNKRVAVITAYYL